MPEEIFATNELAESEEHTEESAVDSFGGQAVQAPQPQAHGGYADVEQALQENARSARQAHIDDEWDEILQRLRETDELSKEELKEITKTRDQIAIGRDEGDDELDDEEVPEEIEEYVSEGYDKELLISIGPTSRDVQLGLRPSNATTEDKDRVFPYPGPKKEGEVIRREIELHRAKDHSLKVILGVLGAVVFLILAAVLLF